MKIFLLIIIFFAFLQSAFLGVNLVLVCLIARSLAVEGRDNLYLAFFGGLALSFLSQDNLGYWALLFLVIVKLGLLISRLPISFNLLSIFLSGSILVFLTAGINMLFLRQNFELMPHVLEAVLILPVYFFAKVWEERFVVKRSIRLKI